MITLRECVPHVKYGPVFDTLSLFSLGHRQAAECGDDGLPSLQSASELFIRLFLNERRRLNVTSSSSSWCCSLTFRNITGCIVNKPLSPLGRAGTDAVSRVGLLDECARRYSGLQNVFLKPALLWGRFSPRPSVRGTLWILTLKQGTVESVILFMISQVNHRRVNSGWTSSPSEGSVARKHFKKSNKWKTDERLSHFKLRWSKKEKVSDPHKAAEKWKPPRLQVKLKHNRRPGVH